MPSVTEEDQDQEQALQVTSVEEWGKKSAPPEEGFICPLPSGSVARVKRTLDMPLLLKAGKIPNPLAGIVQRMIDTRSTDFPTEEMDAETLGQLYDLLIQNAYKMILEPPVDMPDPRGTKDGIPIKETAEEYQERLSKWQPKKGHLSIFAIEVPDMVYLFAVGQGAAADLESFRAEQVPTLDAPSPSRQVRRAAKRTPAGGKKRK